MTIAKQKLLKIRKKESLNNSEAQKDAEEHSDLATDITSEHKSIQEGTAAQALAAFSAKHFSTCIPICYSVSFFIPKNLSAASK